METTHFIEWEPDNEPFTEAARITMGLSFMFFICNLVIIGTLVMLIPNSWFYEFSFFVKAVTAFMLSVATTFLYSTHNNGKTIFVHFHTLRKGRSKKPYSVRKRAAEIYYMQALRQKIC